MTEQVKTRLKEGDEVVVLTGKSKGETGKIAKINFKNGTVAVAGVNVAKKHTKPGTVSEEGGILDKDMPLKLSNVALVDPKTSKATKVAYKVEGDKKVRVAKASGTAL